jgi:opacity protein-like surface antigen
VSISYLKLAVASCALVAATVVPAAAQATVGANLNFLRVEEETGVGVAVDAAKNLNPNIAVVGELGYNSFEFGSLMSVLGGVRFSPAVQSTIQPFVQGLVGLERYSEEFEGENFSDNAFAFQIGAGVEVPVNDSLRFRAQYDFRRTDYDGEGFNGHRFGVGVVFPFGGN